MISAEQHVPEDGSARTQQFALIGNLAAYWLLRSNSAQPDQITEAGFTPVGFQDSWHLDIGDETTVDIRYYTRPEDFVRTQKVGIPGSAGQTTTPFKAELQTTNQALADMAPGFMAGLLGDLFEVAPITSSEFPEY